jgi:hypothetical protein
MLVAGLLGASMLGSCATTSEPARSAPYVRNLAIGAELAAGLAAATMRAELPFADPIPQCAGAPVTRSAPGCFVVRYEHREDGSWLPLATHRARIAMPRTLRGELHPQVHIEPASHMPGFGRNADLVVLLRVSATPSGCTISGSLPVLRDHDFASSLERTWQLLSSPRADVSGLRDANLRAFVAHQMLRESAHCGQSGRPREAELALHEATQLGADAPAIELALAQFSLQNGDRDDAARRFWCVAMRSDDPTQRQRAAALAATASTNSPSTSANDLRQQARIQIDQNGLATAAALLHSARRQQPWATVDYGMLEVLHVRSGDDWSAFACALLSREHAPDGIASADLTDSMTRAGMGGLARRLAASQRSELVPVIERTSATGADSIATSVPPR